MKSILRLPIFLLCTGVLFYISCKKERSCANCRETNKPPIAIAGPDQVITLPTDSVLLDGTQSSDPDGKINEWLWTKIAGPASFTITKPTDSITKIKTLVAGIYQFEIKVTDNGGLSAKDTVQIIVNDPTQPNRPPVANAGPDQTLTLPMNTANLDGRSSNDPDNNITSYAWTKISGPSLFSILNIFEVQTQVKNLIEGIYQFELRVTDNSFLIARDTVKIIVNAAPSAINLNLVPFGTLSKARYFIKAGATTNKILFAGGMYGEDCLVPGGDNGESIASVCISNTTRVDIYDIGTGSWSEHELPRYYTGPENAITVGNRVYFSSGVDTAGRTYSNKVDVYDASTNIWSTISLSDSRHSLAVASIGNKIFFAGGYNYPAGVSNKVDIYDVSSNSFSTATLSEARIVSAAVVVGHKILFTGGGYGGWGPVSHTVDIYDDDTKSWSVSQLSVAKSSINAFVIGNEAFFAGLEAPLSPTGSIPVSLSKMEIYNQLTNSWSVKNLDFFTYYLSPPPPVINDKALVFFGRTVHIYDAPTGKWTKSELNMDLGFAATIAAGNSIFIASGGRYPYGGNQVFKLEF